MFCNQCGAKMEDNLTFCTNCGARLAKVAPQDAYRATPQESEQPVINNSYTQTENNSNSTQDNYQSYINNEEKVLVSPVKVNFIQAIKLYFVNIVNFTGRSTPSEFWWAYLFNYIATLILSFVPYIGTLAALGLCVPGLSLSVRRLHDTGKPWTYFLMGLIPFAGPVMLIIRYCKSSDADNEWGPAPKN